MRSSFLLSFLLLLAGCVGDGPRLAPRVAHPSSLPPGENRMQQDHAPTPYSAEQIRGACPAGRWNQYQVDMPGQPARFQRMVFLAGTAEEARLRQDILDADGVVQHSMPRSDLWTVLQSHASFPESATVITEEERVTPAGRFPCWLYTFTSQQQGQLMVERFWFARDLPGPPVAADRTVAGQLEFTMALVAHGTEPPAE